MGLHKRVTLCLLALATLPLGQAAAAEDVPVAERLAAFEQRRDQALEAMRGRPLTVAAVREPLEPGRGQYSRHFAYSIADFASRSFWLEEQLEAANEALKKYARFFIDDRRGRNDRDSFYWAADQICRIVEFYGRNGSRAAGRLLPEVEDLLLEMMWVYARENSKVDSLEEVSAIYARWVWGQTGDAPLPVSANYADTRTWDVIESENHHAMKVTTLWQFARLLSSDARYAEREWQDGLPAKAHYQAWTAYLKHYCRERAREGLFVEMADDSYNIHTLKGFYNVYDFSEDPDLKRLSGNLLTLYYAAWAQEQINGVRGGGKSRMNGTHKDRRAITPVTQVMWYYLGLLRAWEPHSEFFTILSSDYRLPDIVASLILDVEGRGEYSVVNRPLGLARDGLFRNPHYRLDPGNGGIVRLSWCTPDFIIGMPVVQARAFEDWTLISSQTRWGGVIFASHLNARIFAQSKAEEAGANFNQHWGVQHKGTQIVQRLPYPLSRDAEVMRVWFSADGLSTPEEKDGWVFARSPTAFAAVRAAWGDFRWENSVVPSQHGRWMTLEDRDAPVILEVARSLEYSGFEAFQEAVLSTGPKREGNILRYRNPAGVEFTFPVDQSGEPTVNGAPMAEFAGVPFESPFIAIAEDGEVFTIAMGDQRLALNFALQE